MKIKKIPLSHIKPARYNPRKDLQPGDPDYERIRESMERFDLVEPLVWNEANGVLIGGHQRLKVLAAMGHKTVDCVVVNIPDPAKEKQLNIALNRAVGAWALDSLKGLMVDLEAEGVDLKWLDLDELFEGAEGADGGGSEGTEEDEPPDVPKKAVSKRGEIYALGEHRLMCGDATSEADVAQLMEGKKADMVFTDPPYGVSYADKNAFLNAVGRGNRIQTPITKDHETPADMSKFWEQAFRVALSACSEKAVYYSTGPQGGDLLLLLLALREAGWQLKHMLIWAKNNHVLGRSDYHYKHEPILYGWRKDGTHEFYGGHSETSLWEIDRPHKSDLHPTMKPIKLCGRAIHNSSKEGQIVYDPFLGSGSTLIACEQLGRKCFGLEIDPLYTDVIRKRFWKFTHDGEEAGWEAGTAPIPAKNTKPKRKRNAPRGTSKKKKGKS